MKNSEEAIEKVMMGLRHSEAPQGMEHRILTALEAHASIKPASNSRDSRLQGLQPYVQSIARRPIATPAVLACAVAAIIAISVAITTAHRHLQAPAQSKLSTVPAVTPKAYATPHPDAPITSPGPRLPVPKARLVSATYSLNLRELHAINHPAPQLPLTQEEKLLLRVAHSGNPKELAMLNSQVRARKEAEEEAEFQKFAEPPTGRDLE